MKLFRIRLLIVSGVVVIVCGFMYDVLFAGIPYQDPTPEMSARYAFHSNVAGVIIFIGFSGLIVGMLGGIAKFLLFKLKGMVK